MIIYFNLFVASLKILSAMLVTTLFALLSTVGRKNGLGDKKPL